MPGRRLVVLVVLVVVTLVAAVSDGGNRRPHVRSANELTVFDADGVKVGRVFGDPEFPTVVLEVDGRWFALQVRRSQAQSSFSLLFETADCASTPAYMDPQGDRLVQMPALGLPGTTVYLPDLTAPIQTVTVRSFRDFGEECRNFSPTPLTLPLVPAVAIIDLDTVFTPPFSVRAMNTRAWSWTRLPRG